MPDTCIPIAPGVSVSRSRYWSTNTGCVAVSDGTFLIDAGVFPEELASLALDHAPIVGGISTHGHWDHILWAPSLGDQVPRLASRECVDHVDRHRADVLTRVEREATAADVTWNHDHIGQLTAQPFGMIADTMMELLPLPGHAPGHAGVRVNEADVLFVGDMVSDIDPPALDEAPGSLDRYRESLTVLRGLAAEAAVIVPGHGSWCDASNAGRRIDADERYLDALAKTMRSQGSKDITSVAAAVAVAADDERLSTTTGWLLHEANVVDLIGRDTPTPHRRSSA